MNAIKAKFQNENPEILKTITFDQGSEFANFPQIENHLHCKTYYCETHSPWQKGAIENANGLIRRYLPKRTNIDNYNQEDIEKIIDKLNNQPMRCLGYKTPKEAFFECGSEVASAGSIRT